MDTNKTNDSTTENDQEFFVIKIDKRKLKKIALIGGGSLIGAATLTALIQAALETDPDSIPSVETTTESEATESE